MKKLQFSFLFLFLLLLVGCYQPPNIEELPTCSVDEKLIGEICVEIPEEEIDVVYCANNEILYNVCIDKTKPIITGIDDIEIGKYSTFDPLEGVIAIDDVEGDITSQIVVQNFVDTNDYGTYIVKYNVSDSSNNEKEYIRYVTVIYIPLGGDDGLELASNGDFHDGLNNWRIFNNEAGGNAVFTVTEEEILEINILTVPDSIFWSPRISYNGMTIEEGRTYQIQFDIWADEARLFHLQVGEQLNAEPWFTDFRSGATDKILYISEERTTFTILFTMGLETNLNGGVLFEFGHVGEQNLNTTIYLDDFSVKDVTE